MWTWPQTGSVLSCKQGNAWSINLVSTDLFFLCFISPHSLDDTLSLSGYANTYVQVWFCSMSPSVSLRWRSLSLSVLISSFLQFFISKYPCILPTEPSSKRLPNAQILNDGNHVLENLWKIFLHKNDVVYWLGHFLTTVPLKSGMNLTLRIGRKAVTWILRGDPTIPGKIIYRRDYGWWSPLSRKNSLWPRRWSVITALTSVQEK